MKLPSQSELRTLIRQLSEIEATFENAFVGHLLNKKNFGVQTFSLAENRKSYVRCRIFVFNMQYKGLCDNL